MTLAGAVDPYLRGDANLIFLIDEEGESAVEVEEAYLTTLALPGGLQVKAGQFFAPFGRLNVQHPHAWDFADQPVVNGRMFGPDGLRGLGAQLSWLLPTPFYAEATLDLQNSNGETAFSFRSVPGEEFAGRELQRIEVKSPGDLLWLGRLATSFDLSRSLTVVPAFSYARGPNATGPDADTSIAGVDLYGKWKPAANDHGWPFVAVQMEAMERRYEAAEQALDEGLALPAEALGRSRRLPAGALGLQAALGRRAALRLGGRPRRHRRRSAARPAPALDDQPDLLPERVLEAAPAVQPGPRGAPRRHGLFPAAAVRVPVRRPRRPQVLAQAKRAAFKSKKKPKPSRAVRIRELE